MRNQFLSPGVSFRRIRTRSVFPTDPGKVPVDFHPLQKGRRRCGDFRFRLRRTARRDRHDPHDVAGGDVRAQAIGVGVGCICLIIGCFRLLLPVDIAGNRQVVCRDDVVVKAVGGIEGMERVRRTEPRFQRNHLFRTGRVGEKRAGAGGQQRKGQQQDSFHFQKVLV